MRLPDLAIVFSETNRTKVLAAGTLLILVIGVLDWSVTPNVSLGSLYLFPILIMAGFLRPAGIAAVALLCVLLREALSPFAWDDDVVPRTATVLSAFFGAGVLVAELTRARQLALRRLGQIREEVKLRQDAEQELRVLIESTPAAILTVDAQSKVLLANEAAHRLLGCDRQPLAGQPLESHFPVLAGVLGHDGGARFFRSSMECTGRRRNGEVFLAHICFSTYRTESGPRLAAIVWDASENLRDREGLRLDSLMATSRVLIGAMLHEVRNLSAAAAVAHANLGRVPGLVQSEDFQALGTLVKGLSRVASSEWTPAEGRAGSTTDLRTALDELRIVIEPGFAESGAEICWNITPGLPRVRGEHHGLLQVFLNLAQNSHRAMEKAVEKRLTITTSQRAGRVIMRFQDTGPGIPGPERLFQPFQRGADSTGLGLYVSRALIRSFGGDLRYEPQPRGSCFTLHLEAVQVSMEAVS